MKEEKILIVENESIIALDLDVSLKRLGYGSCTVCHSGRDAVEQARKLKPDIILMDIKLGSDIDGIDVAHEIAVFSDVPVIYITAYADEETITRAKTTQPYAYIVKPIDEKILLVNIEMALYKYRAEKQMEQMEAMLRQAQKMEALGTLANGIAHDFNNILSVIFGFAEITLQKLPTGDGLRLNIENILLAAQRARELVKQILTFSRQSESKRKPVQVSLIVKEVLRLIRPSLTSNIEIRTQIKAIDSLTVVDPIQFHQVLVNLCTNAAHAMKPNGGVLKVILEDVDVLPGSNNPGENLQPGTYLCLSVSDTGYGMTEEVKSRIFEPYFTTKNPEEGSGMGLAVVRGIMDNYGGFINVSSTPGNGSLFKVFFHRYNEFNAVSTTPGPSLYGTERILFIDTEQTFVDLGLDSLEHMGYIVVGKNDAGAALEEFRLHPHHFDLIITGLTMPTYSGLQLAEKFREIVPYIPVILCRGFSESISPAEIEHSGINDVVMKPIIIDKLAAAIRNVMKGKTKQ